MDSYRKVRRLNVGSGSGTDDNARSGENGPEQGIEQVSELVAYLKTTNQDGRMAETSSKGKAPATYK